MPIQTLPRPQLSADIDALRADCERLGDTFAGAALLFAAGAAVVLFGGLWMREPLFTISFAFALSAAVAFAIGARAMAQAVRAAPRIVPAYVPISFENAAKRRQAA